MKTRTLNVVLIGNHDEIVLFLDECKIKEVDYYKYYSDGLTSGSLTFKHNDTEYKISYNCSDKLTNADAIIYLNADYQTKKHYEKLRNITKCSAYDYKSANFKNALKCLENITSPEKITGDKNFDQKSSLYLSASMFDKNSPLFVIPHEVNTNISLLYAMKSNRMVQPYIPVLDSADAEVSPLKPNQKTLTSIKLNTSLWRSYNATNANNTEKRGVKRKLDF